MVAVDRFVSADLCILEAVGLLLCREKLDVLAKSGLVALECENVVGLLGQDFRRDVALTAHSVDSHDSFCGGQERFFLTFFPNRGTLEQVPATHTIYTSH